MDRSYPLCQANRLVTIDYDANARLSDEPCNNPVDKIVWKLSDNRYDEYAMGLCLKHYNEIKRE